MHGNHQSHHSANPCDLKAPLSLVFLPLRLQHPILQLQQPPHLSAAWMSNQTSLQLQHHKPKMHQSQHLRGFALGQLVREARAGQLAAALSKASVFMLMMQTQLQQHHQLVLLVFSLMYKATRLLERPRQGERSGARHEVQHLDRPQLERLCQHSHRVRHFHPWTFHHKAVQRSPAQPSPHLPSPTLVPQPLRQKASASALAAICHSLLQASL